MRKVNAIAVALLLMPSAAWGASNTTTISGTSRAEVVDTITITHVNGQALKFGKFTVDVPGTVTVPITGPVVRTGGVSTVPGANTASTDRFIVNGLRNRAVLISTSSGVVTFGTHSMTFTTTRSVTNGVLSNGGSLSVSVGGTLSVGANQHDGIYTGTYTATASYN